MMLTGARVSELFRSTLRPDIGPVVRAEAVELLSAYQKYADYARALEQLRSIFLAKESLAISRGDHFGAVQWHELFDYVDNIVME